MASHIDTFRALHAEGCFLIPNPFDVGSARLFEAAGHVALATTSSGFAATTGRLDGSMSSDELLDHASTLAASVEIPVSVDAEWCYGDDASGVERFVGLLGQTGAAGFSIEDWNPSSAAIDPLEVSVARVKAAVDGAAASGMVLTARCENHLHGVTELDNTIARLIAYAEAGAEVLYAPGLVDSDDLARVVHETGRPVNALIRPGSPTLPELADLGVRRVSIGGAAARIAYGAAVAAVDSLVVTGQYAETTTWLDRAVADRAWTRDASNLGPD